MPGKHYAPPSHYPSHYPPHYAPPSSPPALNLCGSPYDHPPLPAFTVTLHPALAPAPPLPFDVALPPDPRRIPPAVLAQPATNPPLPYLTLACARLPRTIRIDAAAQPIVTVADVLAGLYRALRGTADLKHDLAPLAPAARARVEQAFRDRCARVPPEYVKAEHAAGVKRVDLLAGHTRWAGLVPAPAAAAPEAWQVVLL